MNEEPPPAAVSWAARSVSPRARPLRVERLDGGTHALTHAVRTVEPDGAVVLRRFPYGDDAAVRESAVLAALDGLSGLVPQLLAVDATGSQFGEPAVVVSRLPGEPELAPADVQQWTYGLARGLARIHSHEPENVPGLRNVMERPVSAWGLDGPAAGVVCDAWDQLADEPALFAHYDYWSGNVLWVDRNLSGIVDWTGAALAPPGFDVGWCRLDIALLMGGDAADGFTLAYEQASGKKLANRRLWDLFAVARSHDGVETWADNYGSLRRHDLVPAVLRRRHHDWTQRLLAGG